MNHRNLGRQFIALMTLLAVGVAACHAADEELSIPDMESVTLETQDFVELHCNFYPGGVREKGKDEFEEVTGKKVVPIILMHGWGESESSRNYDYLARYLQKLGHAVIVPDLRGHGASIHVKGIDEPIDREKIPKPLLDSMIYDLNSVRGFLLEKNNTMKLNIDQLVLVAADNISMVAMNWAVKEWSKGDLIGVRRGKDIKAMVLLSPTRSFKGYTVAQTVKHPIFASRASLFHMPVMFFVGKNDRTALADAKTLYSQIDRARPNLDLESYPASERNLKRAELETRFLVELDTQLQGTRLVDERVKMNVERSIAGFIHYKVVMKAGDYQWLDRS